MTDSPQALLTLADWRAAWLAGAGLACGGRVAALVRGGLRLAEGGFSFRLRRAALLRDYVAQRMCERRGAGAGA